MIQGVVADIADRNKGQTTKEADAHGWIKDHADTGNKTEHKTENWHNWEQRSSKAQFFFAVAGFIPLAAEVELTETNAHPDHNHSKGCNSQ